MKKKLRQAIVVIHGMGEQQPNEILNSFVDGVIADDLLKVSRPDKVSESYDSRRIQILDEEEEERKGEEEEERKEATTQTEIYEYHWAHLMAGNKLIHLKPLLIRLLFRWPFDLPGKLLPIWFIIVILGLVITGIWIWAIKEGIETNFKGVLGTLGFGGITIFIFSQVYKFLINFLIHYFVDAARYFDAAPTNQAARDAIRKGLVDLLDGLHSANRYSRIIVVAHSLGSVIAYDAITYLWARMNKLHATTPFHPITDFNELKLLEKNGADLDIKENKFKPYGFDKKFVETKDERERYRCSQRKAWIEKRLSGNPWLITDLLTFGSPLANAQILLAHGIDKLLDKQDICELPRCPPASDPISKEKGYSWRNEWEHQIIHYAAPFAIVRWTNFWFPSDLFAGPLAPNFGYGIEDVKLEEQAYMKILPIISHTKYFKPKWREHITKVLELKADVLLDETSDSPPPDSITQTATGAL